jgi:tetratricopeptide (TPR) repeat protein
MSLSLSMNRWPDAGAAAAPVQLGLAPELLMRAGILRDPSDPEQAYLRARSLANHGQYREARDLIMPHARTADGELRQRITALLARCSMVGGGGDWEQLLTATLAGYQEAHDELGAARTRRDIGNMLMAQGRFDEADAQLKQAYGVFIAHGDPCRAGMVELLRARARLAAGYVKRAEQRVAQALLLLTQSNDARGLALGRLVRARIMALQGDAEAAAKDLVAAERYLSTSGSALDRIRARLARAECLYHLGDARRAADGLKRVLIDVVDLEEVEIRAFVHTLLGQALTDLHPTAARQYLMRGRHLYETMKQAYQVARCDIALARAEHKIGLNARGRLKGIPTDSFGRWPLLAAQYNIARALVSAERDPERSRQALLKSRAFAADNGNRALQHQVDAALRLTGLVSTDEIAAIDTVAVDPRPLVEAGSIPAPAGMLSPRPPEPYQISDSTDRDLIIAPRVPSAVRLITGDTTPKTALVLRPPKAVGIQRR